MWQRKKTAESELAREFRYHLDKLTADYVREGLSPDEAARRARLEFGAIEQIKEDCRDVRGRWLEDLGKDLQFALRGMRRSPGFTAVAVLSLALGIGANTAIFTLIDAVMLRSLPVRDPARLVLATRVREDGSPGTVSYPLYEYLRDGMASVSGAEAETAATAAIVMDGAEESLEAEWVSGTHYGVLGLQPAAGRLIGPTDDVPAPLAPAAVIGYRYWQRRFALDPAAIGKTFTIRDRTFTIVGVTPPGFQGTRPGRDPDVTLPLQMMLTAEQRQEPTNNMLYLMARLQPGVSRAQAGAELQVLWNAFQQKLAGQLPVKGRPNVLRQRAAVFPAANGFNALQYRYRQALFLLMGIVGLVLLLACANVSGMLLARAASRRREVSIRLAIGASRARVMRQFLAESLLLAALGGAAGLVLARWLSQVLVAMLANGGTLLLPVDPDWRVLVFTGAIAFLACLLAGLAPGLHALGSAVNPALKEVRGRGGFGFGKILVIAQLAISMVLAVGATLFIGTLVNLHAIDPGLKIDGILTFGVRVNRPYAPPRSFAVQEELLARVSSLPGVVSASAAQVIALGGGLWTRYVQVEGYKFRADESEEVGFNAIAPNYFATLATPLLAGRDFGARDTDTSPKVAIVNESFARYFFGARPAIGRHVTSVNVTYEIVGVVKDALYQTLRDGRIKTMYIPWTQRPGDQPSSYVYLARASSGDPLRLSAVAERTVRETDPGLRLRAPRTYSAMVDQSLVNERIMATLAGFFGLVAMVVAALGMFGVMAFQVSRRINELGVRMALGARRADIVRLVLREVAVMLVAGAGIGAAGALALTGLARNLLFGLRPTEPAVFAISAVVLCAAALAAAWLPARRASGIDPVSALRHE
jgi:predicted permease